MVFFLRRLREKCTSQPIDIDTQYSGNYTLFKSALAQTSFFGREETTPMMTEISRRHKNRRRSRRRR